MKRNLLSTLLRVSEHGEAARLCDELLAITADDQLLIAHRATAYYMPNDARYAWLHNCAAGACLLPGAAGTKRGH
jgi:hypothetical protein